VEDLSILFMINETAAIFEARGHGFTEVRMPSHNADNTGMEELSIIGS
jgi:hypothetical protein